MKKILIFSSVFALIIGFYFWTAMSNGPYPNNSSAVYYPLLSRAFLEGQLSLDIPPAPELLALSDPYNPKLNLPYRLHDASLYHDKYYLYFGPTPVALLFWPYLILTDHFFPQYLAVPFFCSIGFILSGLLFLAMIRDYFPQIPLWLRIACLASLGMATTSPFLLRRPDIYEVAIGCAFFLLQLTFYSFYRAMQRPDRALPWLLLGSTAIGASVGARYNYVIVSFVFIAALLGIVWQKYTRRERSVWKPLWALVPLAFIGLVLAWYNYARFDDPFEFGRHYQLTGREEIAKVQLIQLNALPCNLWFYFFCPPYLSYKFPFMDALPFVWFKPPDDYVGVEKVCGLFLISPVTLFALALPVLIVRLREPKKRALLVTLLFIAVSAVVIVVPLLCASSATMRYEVDFAPMLVLLGCIMLCYFHSLPIRTKIGRWALNGLFAVILLIGIWSDLCLSFTGYYDYFRFGSPETYVALAQFFHPLEAVFKAIADLFVS